MAPGMPLALYRSLVGKHVTSTHVESVSAIPRLNLDHGCRLPKSIGITKHRRAAAALKELRVIWVTAAWAVYDDGLVAVGAAHLTNEAARLKISVVTRALHRDDILKLYANGEVSGRLIAPLSSVTKTVKRKKRVG